MPLVTFFSVLELPEKNRKGGLQQPPLVRRGLNNETEIKRNENHEKRRKSNKKRIR